jgi:hypothetical protein
MRRHVIYVNEDMLLVVLRQSFSPAPRDKQFPLHTLQFTLDYQSFGTSASLYCA